ncbi:MAG TPA: DUF721 domain-containing protein [Planctomycetota bacterium]|nr:DUF721 domain-containing protein [Planctomycetota bacterium]
MGEERKPGPRLLGDLIAELMKKTARPRRREMTEIAEAWARAAGPEVARRSEPVGFRGGELTVRFESPVLRQEVQAFRRAEILARLQQALPGQRIAVLKCIVRG